LIVYSSFGPILHGFWAGKPRNSLQVVRCSYVVPNKGRRCRFPVLPGTSFCGAHREDESVERVPCPLDPNHTVFKSPGARWGISFPWFWDEIDQFLLPKILCLPWSKNPWIYKL
jgi:hypothetical protein